MHLITHQDIFGHCVAYIYMIEFQKCGLPHCHILVFLDRDHKLSTPAAVDEVICAQYHSTPSIQLG